jgi:hypothetical protein
MKIRRGYLLWEAIFFLCSSPPWGQFIS